MLQVELFGTKGVNPKQMRTASLLFGNEGAYHCVWKAFSIIPSPKKCMEVAFFFRNLLSDLFGFVSKYIDLNKFNPSHS